MVSVMNRRALGQRLQGARNAKGWSQERLAGRLRVSRNTVNRWEMGKRSPGMAMIERVAAELGVAVSALLPELMRDEGRGPLPVEAYLITFDPRRLLGQPYTGYLLSLLAIVDDLKFLRRELIVSQERLRGATPAERSAGVGESGYLFRAICAALHEGGEMFGHLEDHGRAVVEAATAQRPGARDALEVVRAAYRRDRGAQGKPFFEAVRRWVGAHHDPQKLEMELRRGVNAKRLDGTATVTPYSGLGRYSFLDEISTAVVRRAMGGPSDQEFLAQFHRKLGEAITLAEALATVIDDVFSSLVVDESVRMEPSVLRVDPLIARARYQLQKAREARP